jgi:hypothetical protein
MIPATAARSAAMDQAGVKTRPKGVQGSPPEQSSPRLVPQRHHLCDQHAPAAAAMTSDHSMNR